MKHILEKVKDGRSTKITVTENDYEKDYNPISITIENEEDGKCLGSAYYVFHEKKDLSKFIGLLLHVQAKMK